MEPKTIRTLMEDIMAFSNYTKNDHSVIESIERIKNSCDPKLYSILEKQREKLVSAKQKLTMLEKNMDHSTHKGSEVIYNEFIILNIYLMPFLLDILDKLKCDEYGLIIGGTYSTMIRWHNICSLSNMFYHCVNPMIKYHESSNIIYYNSKYHNTMLDPTNKFYQRYSFVLNEYSPAFSDYVKSLTSCPQANIEYKKYGATAVNAFRTHFDVSNKSSLAVFLGANADKLGYLLFDDYLKNNSFNMYVVTGENIKIIDGKIISISNNVECCLCFSKKSPKYMAISLDRNNKYDIRYVDANSVNGEFVDVTKHIIVDQSEFSNIDTTNEDDPTISSPNIHENYDRDIITYLKEDMENNNIKKYAYYRFCELLAYYQNE